MQPLVARRLSCATVIAALTRFACHATVIAALTQPLSSH
jgi:hypothetical protein